MPSNHETERRIGYPALTAEALDLIIDALLWEVRQRDLGARLDLAEQTISRLSDFYTRRWGLPPAITGRVERLHELTARTSPA
jgi:hypothetical protein